ncbi:pyridoxal-dependent decarboxylase [Streptomyces sp. NPDC012637]|uniref:pyridoxal-dependent decarboxylase n=1 Tax=Streptomyces sp. NPDC012637 TaxID=3364842 RepID=UPI0036EC4949
MTSGSTWTARTAAPASSPRASRTATGASSTPTTWFLHPHKWLSTPFDCATLLYRAPRLARAAHTQNASCLDALHTDDDTQWNPSDYAHHLSRRARGLPLWFSLAVHGTRAYSEAIEKALTLARTTAALIRTAPYLELIREPELSAVTFRRIGWTAEDYPEWSARLLAGQTAVAATTGWEGETVARFAFLHPETALARQKRIRWEAAMKEARFQYAEAYRVRHFEAQEAAWRHTTRLAEYVSAVRTRVETMAPRPDQDRSRNMDRLGGSTRGASEPAEHTAPAARHPRTTRGRSQALSRALESLRPLTQHAPNTPPSVTERH